MLPRLVALEDEEISKELARAFQNARYLVGGSQGAGFEATATGVRRECMGKQ